MGPICFIASEETFLFRHFAPALEAAKAKTRDVVALLPGGQPGENQELSGVRIIRTPTTRSSIAVPSLTTETLWFAKELSRLQPSIVVAYSLRMCVILALAQLALPRTQCIYGVTGLGFVGIVRSIKTAVLRLLIFGLLARVPRHRSYFLFENDADPVQTGIARRGHNYAIFMGAGVDPDEFPRRRLPSDAPFRLATVSRLVWSKGVDLAVDAVAELNREGCAVELHIYGAPDPANPRPIDPSTWEGVPGIYYHGVSHRVSELWASYHAAIFPSRGGEGLPRALIEAASSGRPCIVTAVPGCQDFIRSGLEGYVAPAGSMSGLKDAILSLMTQNLAAFSYRARNRVMATSTSRIIRSRYEEIFRTLLERPVNAPTPRTLDGRRFRPRPLAADSLNA